MTEETTTTKGNSNQAGGQRKTQGRAQNRPQRVPVSGNRDVLSVYGKDPAFHYRWVLDLSDGGERIQRFQMAGYEFVYTHEIQGHGSNQVDRPSEEGTVVRKPSGTTAHGVPQYLYLMKIPYEFFDEDQQAKMRDIEERERDMMGDAHPDSDDGRYGSVSIKKGR